MTRRCAVCARAMGRGAVPMCFPCSEAFDRFNRRDATTAGLIRWAAGRARRLVTREHKADVSHAYSRGYELGFAAAGDSSEGHGIYSEVVDGLTGFPPERAPRPAALPDFMATARAMLPRKRR